MEKNNLNQKQLRAITCILETDSIEEAAKKARVGRDSIYRWLREDNFKTRLEDERRTIFEDGLNALRMATSKAAKKMIELLDHNNSNLRRLAAKDILSLTIKVIEIQDLDERIGRLEELLEKRLIS